MPKLYLVAEVDLPTSKCCRRCTNEKPRAEFVRSKAHKAGLYPWCASCRSADRRSPAVLRMCRIRSKRYRQANPEKAAAYSKVYTPIWRKRNRPAFLRICRRFKEARRARMAGVLNDLTASQWQEILLTFNNACAYCLAQDVPLEQEHMQPVSRGGEHTAANIVPACVNCNRRKSAKSLLAFMASELGAPFLQQAA